MKPRTHNVLTVSTLSVYALALPVGSGTVALVTAGLIGLARSPSIAPTDRTDDRVAGEDTSSDTPAS
jgi:hypothetical protein